MEEQLKRNKLQNETSFCWENCIAFLILLLLLLIRLVISANGYVDLRCFNLYDVKDWYLVMLYNLGSLNLVDRFSFFFFCSYFSGKMDRLGEFCEMGVWNSGALLWFETWELTMFFTGFGESTGSFFYYEKKEKIFYFCDSGTMCRDWWMLSNRYLKPNCFTIEIAMVTRLFVHKQAYRL